MKSLLFFEFRCQIRLRSLQRLPEDGEECHHHSEEDGGHEDPAVAGDPVGVLFQKPGGEPDGDGNSNEGEAQRYLCLVIYLRRSTMLPVAPFQIELWEKFTQL